MTEMRHDHHDWHSEEYVEDWLSSDITRDSERKGVLRTILENLEIDHDAVRKVLDVGGGYGLFAGEVLQVFPSATVVVHDFSSPMLDRAGVYLEPFGSRVTFHVADLYDRGWTLGLDGPFDLAVSAIAIHNVRDREAVEAVCADIATLLRPGGGFLDVDFGAPADRIALLQKSGFSSARSVWRDDWMAAVLATR